MLTCRKLIDDHFPVVSIESTCNEALTLMKKHMLERINVVESKESLKFVGQVSSHDIMMKVFDGGRDLSNLIVSEVVDTRVPLAGEETPVKDALLTMVQHSLPSVPVVDEMNVLVGVLTAEEMSENSELKFSWAKFFESADSSLFESNFERTREAYESKAEIELANIISMLDIMELKSRVAAHEGNVNIIKAAIFDEINFVRKDLEVSFKNMREAGDRKWYQMRDEYEVNKHKLNEKLFYLKEPIEQLVARDKPTLSSTGPIKSTK